MKATLLTAAAIAGLALSAGNAWAQSSTINFDVPGPAGWNTASNWIIPNVIDVFVPGDGFPDEVAGISNGGIVTLTTPALFPVAGVVIGETHDATIPNPTEEDGTLNISGTGQLQLIDPMAGGNAALRIGNNGRGVLNMSSGSILADSVSVGGAPESVLNLSGGATLAISGNASTQRNLRIEGPNVVFDVEGNLTVGGTYVPVITGAAHSEITVSSGTATVGGTLRPEFSGYTPSVGDSWTLINANDVNGVFNVDESQAGATPRGTLYDVSYDEGGSGDVVLSFSNRLILQVNRRTGATSIQNAEAGAIDFDSYTIASAAGVLDPAGWMSLQDGGVGAWNEANPTGNALSELNPTASTLVGINATLPLGTAYGFTPTQIGDAVEDIEFRFGIPGASELQGIVEYVGPHNNLVLTVDPDNGDAAITNESMFSADVIGYSISSPSGALMPGDGAWESLQDQAIGAWQEANPSANFLNELNPTGSSLFNMNSRVLIGTPFDIGGMRDLAINFLLDTGRVLDGIVEYGEIEPIMPGGLPGDTNGDNVINIDDLNNVRNNFGAMGSPDGSLMGDAFPFDGIVNIDDLNGVRNNFGAMGGQAVPEPAAWLLLAIGLGAAPLGRRIRRK